MRTKAAFTLIEVLIAIALMGIILPALYKTVTLLQDSNDQLFDYLQTSKEETLTTRTFFLDIASSDGNLTLTNGEFDRLCMARTGNSLYGLSAPKVCWVVLKQDHTLVRVEGQGFHLPVGREEQVHVDAVMKHLTLFDIYWKGDKVLILLQQQHQKPVTFMVQGITRPKPPKNTKKKPKKHKRSNTTSPRKNTAPEPSPVTPPNTL